MITSNYIYGEAANNMHGNIDEAVNAGVLSRKEANEYNYYASCVMSGTHYEGGTPELLQFKLDKFFKKDEIDYADFKAQCIKLSRNKHITVSAPELFEMGKHCYYEGNGETVNVDFLSRFCIDTEAKPKTTKTGE